MRCRVSTDWEKLFIADQPGKTWAAKKAAAEPLFFMNSPARPWIDAMREASGKWLEVETEFLFSDQFNVEGIRLDARYIDAIDFGPEFSGVDEFLDAVQKRYDKDWPGSDVRKENVLLSHLKHGLIADLTGGKGEQAVSKTAR